MSHSSLTRSWEALRHNPWIPLLARGVLGVGILLLLAWIGRGAASRVPIPDREPPLTLEPQPVDGVILAAAPPPPAPSARPCPDEDAPSGFLPDGRLVLNVATKADLVKLPGIGDKRAEAILELRARFGGRFRRLRDLMRVRGIGPRSLAKLRPKLVLDPPEEEEEEEPEAERHEEV